MTRPTTISLEKGRFDPSLPLAFRTTSSFGIRIEELFDTEVDDSQREEELRSVPASRRSDAAKSSAR